MAISSDFSRTMEAAVAAAERNADPLNDAFSLPSAAFSSLVPRKPWAPTFHCAMLAAVGNPSSKQTKTKVGARPLPATRPTALSSFALSRHLNHVGCTCRPSHVPSMQTRVGARPTSAVGWEIPPRIHRRLYTAHLCVRDSDTVVHGHGTRVSSRDVCDGGRSILGIQACPGSAGVVRIDYKATSGLHRTSSL